MKQIKAHIAVSLDGFIATSINLSYFGIRNIVLYRIIGVKVLLVQGASLLIY